MASPLPPNVKSEIRDALAAFIFQPMLEKLADERDRLIEKNAQMHGRQVKHLVWRQVTYSRTDATYELPEHPMCRVHVGIRNEWEKHMAACAEFEQEKHRGMSAIISILNATDSLDDYFELFPDSLQPALRQLEREGKFQLADGVAPPKRLSQEQLDQHAARLSDSVGVIRARLLMNLLD